MHQLQPTKIHLQTLQASTSGSSDLPTQYRDLSLSFLLTGRVAGPFTGFDFSFPKRNLGCPVPSTPLRAGSCVFCKGGSDTADTIGFPCRPACSRAPHSSPLFVQSHDILYTMSRDILYTPAHAGCPTQALCWLAWGFPRFRCGRRLNAGGLPGSGNAQPEGSPSA